MRLMCSGSGERAAKENSLNFPNHNDEKEMRHGVAIFFTVKRVLMWNT